MKALLIAVLLQTGWPPADVDPTKPVEYQNHKLACFWPKPDENGTRKNMVCRKLDPKDLP